MNNDIRLEQHPTNCKIYSSEFIYKKLTNELEIDYDKDFYIIEPAVGTGNLFIPLIRDFLHYTKIQNWSEEKIIQKLENNFYAFDVDQKSLDELICKLNKLIKVQIKWQIEKKNIITIENNKKATHIICNPPYILNRKLLDLQREKLKERFITCKKGNFNILFAFFEYAMNNIVSDGKVAFITTNTYLNIKSALPLRQLLVNTNMLHKVYNFQEEKLFQGAEVNAAITILKKTDQYKYYQSKIDSDKLIFTTKTPNISNYKINERRDNNNEGGNKIADYFDVCGGIATLDNNFYFIKDEEIIEKNERFIRFIKKDSLGISCTFCVEIELIKNVIRPTKKTEKIFSVFPYFGDECSEISSRELEQKYPMAFKYFCSSIKKNKTQIGFGRTQGFRNINSKKYIIPKICNSINILEDDTNALVYSGIYLTPKSNVDDKMIEHCINILLEDSTWEVLQGSLNNTANGYYNISSNLIKEFGI